MKSKNQGLNLQYASDLDALMSNGASQDMKEDRFSKTDYVQNDRNRLNGMPQYQNQGEIPPNNHNDLKNGHRGKYEEQGQEEEGQYDEDEVQFQWDQNNEPQKRYENKYQAAREKRFNDKQKQVINDPQVRDKISNIRIDEFQESKFEQFNQQQQQQQQEESNVNNIAGYDFSISKPRDHKFEDRYRAENDKKSQNYSNTHTITNTNINNQKLSQQASIISQKEDTLLMRNDRLKQKRRNHQKIDEEHEQNDYLAPANIDSSNIPSKRHISSILNENYDKRQIYDNLVASVNHASLVSRTNPQSITPSNIQSAPINEVLQSFYKILMEGDNGMERKKFEVILYLINFYQKFIKTLKSENDQLESKRQKTRTKYRELALKFKSKIEQDKIFPQEIEDLQKKNSDLKSELLFTKKQNESISQELEVKDIEVQTLLKNHTMEMRRYEELLQNTQNGVSEAKQNEFDAAKTNINLKSDLEAALFHKGSMEKEIEEIKNKAKEIYFDNDRLLKDLKLSEEKSLLLEREKDVFKRRCADIESEGNQQVEILKTEINNISSMNFKLKQSAEELINEVCRYKLDVQQLQNRNQSLEEMNILLKQNDQKISQEILKISQSGPLGNKAYMNYNDQQQQQQQPTLPNNYLNSKNFDQPPQSNNYQFRKFDEPTGANIFESKQSIQDAYSNRKGIFQV